jgi:type VII secretion protein EccB
VATKKDLVEAYSFSRRRLVTAFISGAPGGREVEPARPGRTIVGGLALAVLLIAGAAITGIFAPRAPDDWTQPGLVLSKEDGNPYVILEGQDEVVLRPVINSTSAKLILGPDPALRNVPQEEIDKQVVGEDIGILGAPARVPSPDLLIPTGWTACTAAGQGIRVTVREHPTVETRTGGAFLVENDGGYYLIAVAGQGRDPQPRAYSFRLPDDGSARDNTLAALDNLATTVDDAVEVDDDWLALFPEGAPLTEGSFDISRRGAEVDPGEGSGIPGDARVGDVLTDGSTDYLLLADGPAPLTEFASAVYRNLEDEPRVFELSSSLGRAFASSPFAGNQWPDVAPELIEQQPCAVLHAEEGEAPAVLPGALEDDDPDLPASSDDVAAGEKSQGVQAGRGAFVLSASFADADADRGQAFLIDAKGKAYLLEGDAPALLGYADAEHPTVPDEWIELFDEGVPLSRDAALCVPSEEPGESC